MYSAATAVVELKAVSPLPPFRPLLLALPPRTIVCYVYHSVVIVAEHELSSLAQSDAPIQPSPVELRSISFAMCSSAEVAKKTEVRETT